MDISFCKTNNNCLVIRFSSFVYVCIDSNFFRLRGKKSNTVSIQHNKTLMSIMKSTYFSETCVRDHITYNRY